MSLSTRVVAWQGYKLEEMTPQMVHYGTMPQDVLDRENESVRLLLERNGKPPQPTRMDGQNTSQPAYIEYGCLSSCSAWSARWHP